MGTRRKSRIKEPGQKKSGNRIPEPIRQETTHHDYVTVSFTHLCERNLQLEELGKRDLKQLSNFLRRVSSMTWQQVRNSDGIKMKKIPRYSISYPVPQTVSEDEDIFEMRVSQEHRLWGFPNNGTFYIIWFDPTHAVCPA
ncbi:MAG6450 family protein [Niallia circulans]|uniref:MAG6450 family protein n=1 Tax=Niallia circulans TaxID=1397 RepID=UPI003518957E